MIYDAERRKGGGLVLGVRSGSGGPGPLGTVPGFNFADELGQEAAELIREVNEAKASHAATGSERVDLGAVSYMSFEEFDAIVTGAGH